MKKILFVILSAMTAASVDAQVIYDALSFCQNNYYGTARTMALGNAVTAVGGDLGSLGINPAGSSVSNYGQVTFTPGLTISSVASSYSPEGDRNFGPSDRTNRTRFNIPNVGIQLRFNTGRSSGVKSFSVSFTANGTNSFLNSSEAFGTSSSTSRLAEFAAAATEQGYSPSVLGSTDSYYSTDAPWDLLTGYQGGLFSYYGGGRSFSYVGASELLSGSGAYHYVPGELHQSSARNSYGTKRDLLLNFGLNVNDFLYIGVNIGLPVARYSFNEYYTESSVMPELFPVRFTDEKTGKAVDTYYKGATSDYFYSARLAGVYGKLGVIVLPFENLRVGAAIQTPTSFSVTESWSYNASSEMANPAYSYAAQSPVGTYSYRITAPFSANFGVAYTLPSIGLLSIDYELTDYSLIRYRDTGGGRRYSDTFAEANRAIKECFGISHYLRAGLEVRINPMFSARAGYNLITSAEKGYSGKTMSYAIGAGYSSSDSFFADLALRLTSYPTNYYGPYYDYDNYDRSGRRVDVPSPVVSCGRKLWDIALTLGWRF